MRIIDTPGVADTRGHDVEKLNMEKILSFLSQYEYVILFASPNRSILARFTLSALR